MYLYKQGTVSHVIVSNQGGSVGDVAFIVLKDVVTVAAPKINHNWIAEEIEKNRAAMRERVKSRASVGSNLLRSKRFSGGETKSFSIGSSVPDIVVTPKKKSKTPVIVKKAAPTPSQRFKKFANVGF
jgi:hypothetical protein